MVETCQRIIEVGVVLRSKLVDQELVDFLSKRADVHLVDVLSKHLEEFLVLGLKLLSQVSLLLIVVLESLEWVVYDLEENILHLFLGDHLRLSQDAVCEVCQLHDHLVDSQQVVVDDEFKQLFVVLIHHLTPSKDDVLLVWRQIKLQN